MTTIQKMQYRKLTEINNSKKTTKIYKIFYEEKLSQYRSNLEVNLLGTFLTSFFLTRKRDEFAFNKVLLVTEYHFDNDKLHFVGFFMIKRILGIKTLFVETFGISNSASYRQDRFCFFCVGRKKYE